MVEKTNVQHLRDILKELELSDSIKAGEGLEFLEAIEEEIKDKDEEIDKLELDDDDDEKEKDEIDYDNADFVGLDTIFWSLEKDNLKIQMQMEQFIHGLKKQNLVSA